LTEIAVSVILKRYSAKSGAMALDEGNKAVGWETGLASGIAKMPAECLVLVDGLIID
jgi:hypothetical protein